MHTLLRWIIGAVALFITVKIGESLQIGLAFAPTPAASPGGSQALGTIASALIAVLALTLVNALIRPIVRFFTAPLNCLTLGLFSFVVNALMFWLVGALDLGLKVNGFIPALFGSVALSLISGVLNVFLINKDEDKGKR